MPRVLSILFGAAFTVTVSMALGTLLVRALGVRFCRQEERFFAFATGSACLSMLVFALAAVHIVYPGVLLAVGALALAAALWRRAWKPMGEPLAPVSRGWGALFWTLFALFTYVSFFHAMAPEISPDGAGYHLGIVLRYLNAHGFRHVLSLYAYLSQGTELLYLFAFAFGRHSAAALVHFSFLAALPFGMMLYARRFGFGPAGVVAALLIYLSPIVNWDGSTAFIDVAVACVLFALFYLLQIWDEDRQPGLLVLAGLLAGFAYGMKYTAFVAVLYAVGFVAWKSYRKRAAVLRPVAVVAAVAALMIAPWMIRNWIWTGNPLAPFYNQWFPNPYIHIAVEQAWRADLARWGGVTDWREIPLQVTVEGDKLQGFFGPVFLLAPLALAALWKRQGRQLLLAAAVFLTTYPANIGTRFLIPTAVFLALAMGMTLVRWKAIAVVVLCAHAGMSWPRFTKFYADRCALRTFRVPVAAALRIEPEEAYLDYWMPTIKLARLVERMVPPDAKVLGLDSPPWAYCARELLVTYECAQCNTLFEMVAGGLEPLARYEFRFRSQELTAVRARQTDNVNEFRVLNGSAELVRDLGWRVIAHPNPWEAGMAFDGNPATRWKSWQPRNGKEVLEVDFGAPRQMDSVTLDALPGQNEVQLEGRDAAGNWQPLAGPPVETVVPPPTAIRRMIARELLRQGVGYILVPGSFAVAGDLRARPADWGVTALGESGGVALYRID
ncbi:MAG TPA: discoidin domain-containing protein [Bryobacteraceae bacterium]|nr:discoidin domain-containing protein [Bryobacteraceae bacterium]